MLQGLVTHYYSLFLVSFLANTVRIQFFPNEINKIIEVCSLSSFSKTVKLADGFKIPSTGSGMIKIELKNFLLSPDMDFNLINLRTLQEADFSLHKSSNKTFEILDRNQTAILEEFYYFLGISLDYGEGNQTYQIFEWGAVNVKLTNHVNFYHNIFPATSNNSKKEANDCLFTVPLIINDQAPAKPSTPQTADDQEESKIIPMEPQVANIQENKIIPNSAPPQPILTKKNYVFFPANDPPRHKISRIINKADILSELQQPLNNANTVLIH
ncbi:hypothetical protein O181_047709 [Austropuccinia psidii MF-1]|uniref:Uncharacterized protein n=1 Tax=Austropuccinia psidii MF-1 TaxID=1389203 RepID=A0A9Q3DRD1_9BASI|nr:hypothetical protein [Austropuccinia psidii MF-1]